MNDFKPVIKPTPLPKIVTDRNRELTGNNSNPAAPVLSNSAPMTFNANAKPSEGGFSNGLGKFLREQSEKIQAQQAQQAQANSGRHRKNSTSNGAGQLIGWGIFALFFALPFLGSIIAGIAGEFDLDFDTEPETQITQVAETDDSSAGEPSTINTNCYTVTIPNSDYVNQDSTLSCPVFAYPISIYGKKSNSTSFFDDSSLYSTIEEYAEFYNYTLTDSVTYGENTFYLIDNNFSAEASIEYNLWVDDKNILDQNGEKLEVISIQFDSTSDSSAESIESVLESFQLKI